MGRHWLSKRVKGFTSVFRLAITIKIIDSRTPFTDMKSNYIRYKNCDEICLIHSKTSTLQPLTFGNG